MTSCLISVSGTTGEIVWTVGVDAAIFSSPILHNNNSVVFGCHDCHVYHVDRKSGAVRRKMAAASHPVFASLDATGTAGRLLAANIAGRLTVWDDVDEGRTALPLAEIQLGGHVFSSPVFLAPDRFVVGCRDNFLYCCRLDPLG